MTKFNVLYLVENNLDGTTDNRIIILFDANEKMFYYYGTRSKDIDSYNNNKNNKNKNNDNEYVEYWGEYYEDNYRTLVTLLKYTNDIFRSKINTYLHFIDIDEYEFDELNFEKLYEKMTEFNEIFGYENIFETENSITEKLELLKNFRSSYEF
jgi:hypothetical protein